METRSKARVGQAPELDPGPAGGTPEAPVSRSSSDLSLHLAVLTDDGGASDVGSGRPTVRALSNPKTTSLDNTLADQPRDAAGVDSVTEPEYYSGSTADNIITAQHRQQPKNPTLMYFIRPRDVYRRVLLSYV